MPLNLLPIFQLMLSMPSSMPGGASRSSSTPNEWNLYVVFSYIIMIINQIKIWTIKNYTNLHESIRLRVLSKPAIFIANGCNGMVIF